LATKLDPTVKELKRLFNFNKHWKERLPFLRKLKVLPAALDPALAKTVFRAMFVDTYHDPSLAELITPEYARAALAAYGEKNFAFFDASAAWICAAVNAQADDAALARQLREAFVGLKRLSTPVHATTREGIDATLKNPRFVEATQAAIAATPDDWNWSRAMVGLLLADGSASSIDVLIPMALRALKERKDELDRLRDLTVKYGAATPEVKAFAARLHAETDDRAAKSGANAFGAKLGLERKNDFQFKAVFHGLRKNGTQIFECTLRVDAGDARWGSMSLSWTGGRRWRQNEWTNDGERLWANSPLGKLEKFPTWLRALATERKCTFKRVSLATNLEGPDAKRLGEWLEGAVTPPASAATRAPRRASS
jgi:hypothetical protein